MPQTTQLLLMELKIRECEFFCFLSACTLKRMWGSNVYKNNSDVCFTELYPVSYLHAIINIGSVAFIQ